MEQEYTPFVEEEEVEDLTPIGSLEQEKEETIAIHPLPEESPYDNMSLKELQSAVRAKGLPSEKGAKKQSLIDLLKRSDQTGEVKPGSTRSLSLLEVSSPLSEDVE